MGDVFSEAEEAQHDPHQTDGLDLDVAEAAEVHPQSGGPGILARQEVVGHQVLRLGLDLLQAEEDEVRRGVGEEGGEVDLVGELDGHVPCDQLEAEDKSGSASGISRYFSL